MPKSSFTVGLSAESSPYLRQHADNPVLWYPWTPEAFASAHKRDVPILLSIGYAACHWCHVMAHESFENSAIAEQMNQNFVCIKVDREERPDVDAVYMRATQLLNNGHGGWPMTVFLTPDARPFFAGTYYAPVEKQGRLGFPELMHRISKLWRERREEVEGDAKQLTRYLQTVGPSQTAKSVTSPRLNELRQQAVDALGERFDPKDGGFGGAPKFPPVAQVRLLLDRVTREKDATAQMMAETTLDAMVQGGFYDLVGGGFSRYATDTQWRVPHFEKMLYDNALLASLYCEAARALRAPRFLKIAERTIAFLLREMRGPDGGFIASLDADTEGEEGFYYTYTWSDLEQALGNEQLDLASRVLSCRKDGNWEAGRNILSCVSRSSDEGALDALYEALFHHRQSRSAPGRDDKIIVGHNGLAISALVQVANALDSPELLAIADKTAELCWARAFGENGRLARLASPSPRILEGVLEDYAYLAKALVELAEATSSEKTQRRACNLIERMADHFIDPSTRRLVMTADDQERLLFRPAEAHDSATPSAQAIAVEAWRKIVKIHDLSNEANQAFRQAEHALKLDAAAHPAGFCQSLVALR